MEKLLWIRGICKYHRRTANKNNMRGKAYDCRWSTWRCSPKPEMSRDPCKKSTTRSRKGRVGVSRPHHPVRDGHDSIRGSERTGLFWRRWHRLIRRQERRPSCGHTGKPRVGRTALPSPPMSGLSSREGSARKWSIQQLPIRSKGRMLLKFQHFNCLKLVKLKSFSNQKMWLDDEPLRGK